MRDIPFGLLCVASAQTPASKSRKSDDNAQLEALAKKIDEQNAKIDALSQEILKLEQQIAHMRPGVMIGESTPSTTTPTAEAGSPSHPASGNTHIVARGETLTSIAKMCKVTVDELQNANHIEDGRKLQAGTDHHCPGCVARHLPVRHRQQSDTRLVNQSWFLRKHEDGSTFGPVRFDQIARWAAAAQIAPHDTLSNDRQTWVKAPMLAQLGMDWLVELTSEHYYGPTTLRRSQEFIRLGEIDGETLVINTRNGALARFRKCRSCGKRDEADAGVAQTEIQLGDPVGPAVARMSVSLSRNRFVISNKTWKKSAAL